MITPTTIDVETFRIEGRPDYPPIPVGVAIKEWHQPARYYGFYHVVPSDDRPELVAAHVWNNSTGTEAVEAVRRAYANPSGILFHNAKFDLDVIETYFHIKPPPWGRIHDTMFLLFLDDPNQKMIGLKPAAQRLLGIPPEERDVLAEWLHKHQPVPGVRVLKAAAGKHPPGAYIAYAPTDIVGPYAIGDVDRTEKLFELLHPRILNAGMGPSYERELRLLPVLLDMERRGVAIDLDRLRTDIERYQRALAKAEGWVRERIGAEAEVNLDSGPQLIAALDRAGLVDKSKLGTTEKTGKLSSAKASIDAAVTDRTLAATLRYVGALRTCLSTFLLPWERTAAASGGRIFTSWNQTRGNGGGARTGRLSSSPNFQNIPVEFNDFFANDAPMIALPPLPLCRTYITAYPGHTLLGRDYNSQELRILAHFEDGEMLDRYIEDPGIDIHQYAADMVSKFTGRKISRKVAKAIDFGILYGAGAINLSRQLNCSVGEASSLLNAFHKAFPGVKRLQRALQFRAATKQPVRTVGGRLYHVEPPIDGKEFSYKLVNTIIQGSAADQTKDAMIAIHERAGPGKLILSVHDEIVLSVPQDTAEDDMAIMRVIMNTSPIDTPMKSEGEVGHNWAEMHKHA